MKLEQTNGLRILKADEGCVLRRKSDADNFSKVFYLGINDNEDNFEEVTQELEQELTAQQPEPK